VIEFRGMYETLERLAFSPDGTTIAACSDKHLYWWDASDPKTARRAAPPMGH